MKSFIYLDEYKMYSISSQIFEGLTEYILKSESDNIQETSEQKGGIGSGRVMADILAKNSSQTERRFLHDYAYTLFENQLLENGSVLTLDASSLSISLVDIHDAKFIKVTGQAVFNDTKMVHELIATYNSKLRALRYAEIGNAIEKEAIDLAEQIKNIPDRNKRANNQAMLKSKVNKVKKAEGELSEEYTKNLEYIIKEFYENDLSFQIILEDEIDISMFSASLNRDNLKESILQIIRKYGRQTEREFTLFGILTQSGKKVNDVLSFVESKVEDGGAGMRLAILNMINLMGSVDKTLTGRLDKYDLQEYIIDPIAIYHQL